MKVVGAGFGRTGTLSLKAALEQLGFGPCYHMSETAGNPARSRQWIAAAEGNPDWEAIFAEYHSCVDWPASAFWRELSEYYPDSRIILTVRDPQQWYDSCAATIFRRSGWLDHPLGRAVSSLLLVANPRLRDTSTMFRVIVREGVFDGRFRDREHTLAVFDGHVRAVRAQVPKDRLLVFDVRQGWEPLCAFLGVPVPDGPFPHVNEAAAMRGRLRRRSAGMALRPSAAIAAALVAVLLRRRGRLRQSAGNQEPFLRHRRTKWW